jgi:opacity protein-like surface antigen
MKNIKLWITLIVLISTQIINAQQMRFGITTSPGFSWFKTDISRIKGDGTKLGINIGLMVDRYFAEHYAFSTGLSINSIGGLLSYNEGTILHTNSGNDTLPPGSKVKYKLQYLHVPFSLKFKTTEIGYITYYAQLGLDAMVNIKARADVKAESISGANVSEEINLLYLGYHIGAGIEYKIIGNTSIVAGIKYMNGFTDVTTNNREKTLMHGIELKLGVLF